MVSQSQPKPAQASARDVNRYKMGTYSKRSAHSAGPGEWAKVIVPKSVPRGFRMVLEIMVVLACLLEPPKINFWPTWLQLGLQMDPQKLLFWRFLEAQKRSQDGFRNEVHLGPVLGLSWGRFWTIFEQKV